MCNAQTSSQYTSSLLLAAPYARAPLTRITLSAGSDGQVVSESYIAMTVAVMRVWGVAVQYDAATHTYTVPNTG